MVSNFFGVEKTNIEIARDRRNELLDKGIKRTIFLPSIPASGMVQYNRDHAKIQSGLKPYKRFNFISVTNTDVVNIKVELDFASDKTFYIPAGSMITIDMIDFMEFNVYNLDTSAASNANKIIIVVGYEPELLRDKSKIKKVMY
jgi:hypothetical protein